MPGCGRGDWIGSGRWFPEMSGDQEGVGDEPEVVADFDFVVFRRLLKKVRDQP